MVNDSKLTVETELSEKLPEVVANGVSKLKVGGPVSGPSGVPRL